MSLFYKYFKSDNLAFSMLRRGEVYFASVGELNDASECRPRLIFKGSEELWQRFAEHILISACCSSDYFQPERGDDVKSLVALSGPIGTRLKKTVGNRDLGIESLKEEFHEALQHCWSDSGISVNRAFYVDLVQTFIERELPRTIESNRYIASFSRNATNPTMWGHYAEAERGFVVVYETIDGRLRVNSPISVLQGRRPVVDAEGTTEIGTYKDESLELKEVKYGRRVPKVNAFHRLIHQFTYSEEEYHYDVPLLIAGDAQNKEEHQIGLVKYSDWRYEREIRAFFPTLDKLPPDARVLQVELPCLKGVVFGPQMSRGNIARAIICCHLMVESRGKVETPIEFQFFQARRSAERFNFEIAPLGMLGNSYFMGHLPFIPLRRLDVDATERIRIAATAITASGPARED